MTTYDPHASKGKVLAIGFGTTVAMWAIAYFAMMKPGFIVGEVLFTLTLACLFVGGHIAARHARSNEAPWVAGLKIGLTVGLLNLLLVGSLARGETPPEQIVSFAFWTLGNILTSIAIASLGGAFATLFENRNDPSVNWFNRFTIVAAATVFLLLITGGLVTGLRAGLAVPDWPNSFGHNMLLYPLSEMFGGIYYEHAHRLYGMLVGVTAITLVIATFKSDGRRWLRHLAICYLILVCVQGLLGGWGRVLQREIWYAVIHGVFGQIVFAIIVVIAAVTSSSWRLKYSATTRSSAGADRTLTTLLPLMLLIQLGLGAVYRHLRREWDLGPEPLHVLYTHIVVAILVLVVTIAAAGRAWGIHRDQPVLPALGRWLLCLVGLQITLGVLAMIVVWSRSESTVLEVIITTAHQATGALLLASATLLMLWTRRLLAAKPDHAGARPAVAAL